MQKLVYENNFRERIDSFLTANFSYSRNFFHHIIERGWVLVNWKKVKKSYKLKQNDIIEIDNLERYLDSSFLEELPFVDIPIVLEKKDYLVINKPKWVLSHPNSIWDLSAPSVVAFLYQKYKELPSIWNFVRAWLVHRLDKETDWLMIVAKTEKWLEYFKNLFNKKSQLVEEILQELDKENPDYTKLEEIEENVGLKKFYRAKVELTPKWKTFLESITLPYYITELVKPKVPHAVEKMGITKIVKNEKWRVNNNLKNQINSEKWIMKNKEDSKWFENDILWYRKDNFLLTSSESSSDLFLQIITWRTHQIRYHLSQKWLPIVWDYLYWKESKTPMQLTAYKLDFVDVEGEKVSLEI